MHEYVRGAAAAFYFVRGVGGGILRQAGQASSTPFISPGFRRIARVQPCRYPRERGVRVARLEPPATYVSGKLRLMEWDVVVRKVPSSKLSRKLPPVSTCDVDFRCAPHETAKQNWNAELTDTMTWVLFCTVLCVYYVVLQPDIPRVHA
ncbi:hypothetical protein BV20DRAFT_696571 [Pilatotrama ljubarskyi]|nr:hypothetical protein BV20DRAFT_696571 [Pilatotrama ljubarskyi]